MWPTIASRSRARTCTARRSNGRRRAARARGGSPGNTCRTSRGGSAFPWRSRPPHADQLLEVALVLIEVGFRKSVAEIMRRVDRGRSLADLEVQLRRVDVAGLAGERDGLPALDLIAALDLDLAGMGVGGDEAVGMPHQDEVAVALELVARIGDHALLGRLD